MLLQWLFGSESWCVPSIALRSNWTAHHERATVAITSKCYLMISIWAFFSALHKPCCYSKTPKRPVTTIALQRGARLVHWARSFGLKKSASRFDFVLFLFHSTTFFQQARQMSLSTGAIKVLYNDEKSNPLYTDPTVQIINIKAVTVQGGIRHR